MNRFALLLTLFLPVACSAPGSRELAEVLAAQDGSGTQVSVLVVDLDTGERVFARDERRLCRPASTMKLLPTSAICRLAPDGVVATRLVASALPEGEVTLLGNGDPMLSASEVRDLAVALKAKGLTKAIGSVRCSDPLMRSPRYGKGWMWDDEPAPFMPVLSAATIDGGCVTVQAKQGANGFEVELLPVTGPLELRYRGGDGRFVSGRSWQSSVIYASGSKVGDRVVERRYTVPDPALYTAHVVGDALQRAGLREPPFGSEVVTNRFVQRPQQEARFERTIADIVVHTNKVSDNLGAEMLLRWVGAKAPLRELSASAQSPDDLAADCQAFGEQFLVRELRRLGFEEADFRIADGSGVSHYNLLSAELLVRLLVDMHEVGGPSYDLFRRSLPIAGVDGTLARRMKDTAAEGNVFAKTGTISAVSNLAGYVDTKSGRRLAFAILCQNFVGASGPWRDLQDRICTALAKL